jgi:hypothetical protein
MSMIDDEFAVCFELPLSVMLAKRRLWRVPVAGAGSCQSNIPRAQKNKKIKKMMTIATGTGEGTSRYGIISLITNKSLRSGNH